MEKYKYKCENELCNHIFIDENPTNCPKCGCDDIIIIGEVRPPWYKLIIGILLLGVISTATYYAITSDVKDDETIVVKDGDVVRKDLKYEFGENYIKVISPKVEDFTALNFRLEHSTEGDEVYREGDKFYPCKKSSYTFKWEDTENLKLKEDDNIRFKFKFDGKESHQNACDEVLEIYSVNPDSDCNYTITVNLNKDKIEVSDNSEGPFTKGKLRWTYSEVGSSPTFYVKQIGTNILKSKTANCQKTNNYIPPTASEVVESFNLFKVNPNENDEQFVEIFGVYPPDIVILKGEENTFTDFLMEVLIQNDNTNGSYSKGLRLNESDVEFENNKVVKLKVR